MNKQPKTRKPRKPNPNIPPENLCPKCKRYKFNAQCSLALCKTCCANSTDKCTYTDHRRAKLGARQPPPPTTAAPPSSGEPNVIPEGIKERLEAAIDAKKDVFISYKKGTHGSPPRKVTPNAFRLGKEGLLVETYCHTAKENRSFYVHLIARIEDHDWEQREDNVAPPQAPPPPTVISTRPETVEQWLKGLDLERYWPVCVRKKRIRHPPRAA